MGCREMGKGLWIFCWECLKVVLMREVGKNRQSRWTETSSGVGKSVEAAETSLIF